MILARTVLPFISPLLGAFALFLLPLSGVAWVPNIATVAGGFVGDGGPATAARLSYPPGVAIDASGNVYFADEDHHRIRKVEVATGIISTVAGNGTNGFLGDGGVATAASLNGPVGVVLDQAGNLYITDAKNQRIRKVAASTGIISTVAGGASSGLGDGGGATNARLRRPTGVALDASGNLYIADEYDDRIRKVAAASGVISTVAGSGTSGFSGDGGQATAANLDFPSGVAVAANGDLFIADRLNNRIRKVTSGSGVISTVAGNGTTGASGDGDIATDAGLYGPSGVRLDAAGNLYIADTYNGRIRKVAVVTGIISTVAGGGSSDPGDGGPATAARLSYPEGVAVDASGNLYIADTYGNRIHKVAVTTKTISTVAGRGDIAFAGDGGAATTAMLDSPAGVVVDADGNLYIADEDNGRIRRVGAATGIISTVAGGGSSNPGNGGPATAARLSYPASLALDASGNLYIADTFNNRIRKLEVATGIISTVAGSGDYGYAGDGGVATAASLRSPAGIALDASGTLYIADTYNDRVRRVAAGTGTISTVAGGGSGGLGDGGLATAASLNHPTGVALDANGNLYIADRYNNRIRKVAALTGIISTVAGGGSGGLADGGLATAASLSLPAEVTLDASGNLYIADSYDDRIRKVTAATGLISTVAGNGTRGFLGDGGTATAAQLNKPVGIALDAIGNLYFADQDNNRVRKVDLAEPVYSRNYVQKAYVAYYGRPADPGGLNYWAARMDAEGGSLNAIIGAFGYSDEFSRRYGGLSYTQLVTKIYQQTLGRDPDPAGLTYYVGELQAGRRTLQSITLDVLNGATTAPDSTVVANKLDVAAYYTAKVVAGCAYGTDQDGVNSLSGVTSVVATVTAAKAAIDFRCGP